jgi:SAM-dependent methyltransferase
MLVALLVAILAGVMGSVWATTLMRRVLMALGFPLSWLALAGSGGAGMAIGLPAWVWLVPLTLAWLLYPPGTWRDAPLFPTPNGALDGLGDTVRLPLAGHVLDAGCGLGDGLLALERAFPEVHLHGVEHSWPLRLLCALRARHATVRQGDIWAHDWSMYDLVYVFQRPESMTRAWAKAQSDLRARRVAGQSGVSRARRATRSSVDVPGWANFVAVSAWNRPEERRLNWLNDTSEIPSVYAEGASTPRVRLTWSDRGKFEDFPCCP